MNARHLLSLAVSIGLGAGAISLAGCEPNQSGTAGGYHSTSSEQNVGTRSSHGLYGGTVDSTGTAGGGTYGHYQPGTPATPYSNQTTPSNGTTPAANQSVNGTDSGSTPYNGGASLPPRGTNGSITPPPSPSGGTSQQNAGSTSGTSADPGMGSR